MSFNTNGSFVRTPAASSTSTVDTITTTTSTVTGSTPLPETPTLPQSTTSSKSLILHTSKSALRDPSRSHTTTTRSNSFNSTAESRSSVVTIHEDDTAKKTGEVWGAVETNTASENGSSRLKANASSQKMMKKKVACRCAQVLCTLILYACLEPGLANQEQTREIRHFNIAVLLTSGTYFSTNIALASTPSVASRFEYAAAVLVLDTLMAFFWGICIMLSKLHGPAKLLSTLTGVTNILLLFFTVYLESCSMFADQSEAVHEHVEAAIRSNPLMDVPDRVAKPSVRSIATVGGLTGARSKVTGGKSELTTAPSK
ncbi:hypothetical protein BJ741DRAFT_634486 [Chytriomyces cf. hyalinus JEL632]|nr:hypothetical protein BJ741DRAFT_634486 [Chytriomyces cf. hyalinus JEL632]